MEISRSCPRPPFVCPSSNLALAAHTAFHKDIVNILNERRIVLEAALHHLALQANDITEAGLLLIATLRDGQKVLVAGNGGSATEAQHFAAELVGRFKCDRDAYAVLALNTDTAILTAVANDYGYKHVFARQIQALGRPGDLFIAYSTSGESENLLYAAQCAQSTFMKVLAITGSQPSRLEKAADITIHVPGVDTATSQELHMIITHILCERAESSLSEAQNIDEPALDNRDFEEIQTVVSTYKENES